MWYIPHIIMHKDVKCAIITALCMKWGCRIIMQFWALTIYAMNMFLKLLLVALNAISWEQLSDTWRRKRTYDQALTDCLNYPVTSAFDYRISLSFYMWIIEVWHTVAIVGNQQNTMYIYSVVKLNWTKAF